MGWTHDYRDVARKPGSAVRSLPGNAAPDPRAAGDAPLGIPHILRRRARWVGARLRQSRAE
jgi:hypothetical protein